MKKAKTGAKEKGSVFGPGPYRRKGIFDAQRASDDIKFFSPAALARRRVTSKMCGVDDPHRLCTLVNWKIPRLPAKRLVTKKRVLVERAGAHLANDREKDERAERKRLKWHIYRKSKERVVAKI